MTSNGSCSVGAYASPIASAQAPGHDGGDMGGTLRPALTETEHLAHDLTVPLSLAPSSN